MGCCNDISTALAPSTQDDPTLRVNYAKGMVLGVDDFTQEHTYLSGRDSRMVSEFISYGATIGLAVTVEDTSEGPRVRVTRGSAAAPSGKLICVPADQCGLINKWLAKPENAKKVGELTHDRRRHRSRSISPSVTPTARPRWCRFRGSRVVPKKS
jgi:hypothetical protein